MIAFNYLVPCCFQHSLARSCGARVVSVAFSFAFSALPMHLARWILDLVYSQFVWVMLFIFHGTLEW